MKKCPSCKQGIVTKTFKPYYKNYKDKQTEIAKLLKTTDWTYYQIGKKLGVSDHSVTDANKELNIRPRKPRVSKVRPTFELYRANRGVEANE